METLRAEGFDGRIVLFGDESHLPYERPPLSKGYLQGTDERETVFVHPEGWYAEHDVDLRLGAPVDRPRPARARADDPRRRRRALRPAPAGHRRHARAGCGAGRGPPLHYLRTLDDSDALARRVPPGPELVVVGGGWIGLEAAAARAAPAPR